MGGCSESGSKAQQSPRATILLGSFGTPLEAYDVHIMFMMGFIIWTRIFDTDEAEGTFA